MAFHRRQPPPPPPAVLLLTLTSLLSLTSPSHALKCSSQKLTNNLYTNCTDLPTLNSSLHWTHIINTSSISIAFVAPPSKPDGWIAWAINPTRTGMAGSQALIAFKDSNGSMTVKTYNISSYTSIVEGAIAFEVSDSRAEFSDGSMKIYATVKLPETMTEVNHVWQVGGSVAEGVPVKHDFSPENLNAKGKLKLRLPEKSGGATAGGPTAGGPTAGGAIAGGSIGGGPAGAPVVSPNPSASSSGGYENSVMYVFLMLIIGALMLN